VKIPDIRALFKITFGHRFNTEIPDKSGKCQTHGKP